MPRAPKLSAEEFARRSPGAKGIYRTSKKGQKFFIAFEKKHKYPQGRGIRVQFGRGISGSLTSELASIKRAQERAERQAKIKKGIGLFDNPLSSEPRVIGVKRIVRKAQVKAQIRRYQQGLVQGKRIKLSKKALERLQRRGGSSSSRSRLLESGTIVKSVR